MHARHFAEMSALDFFKCNELIATACGTGLKISVMWSSYSLECTIPLASIFKAAVEDEAT